MIVYSVHMNLQADFVRVASSFAWTVTSLFTKTLGLKIKQKAKINCKQGDLWRAVSVRFSVKL